MSVAPTPELLKQVARLITPAGRVPAAREIARAFGAKDVLVLLRDAATDSLIPAGGFASTIPDPQLWHAFVESCVEHGEHRGELQIEAGTAPLPSIGFATGADAVLLIIGAQPALADVQWLRSLFPLIAAALRSDHATANRAKAEFLATMSHELRTPLNAIGGHAALLAMGLYGPITADQQKALDRIDRSQRHLLGLINDILNLSRIEAGKVQYRLTDVSLDQAMEELTPMITAQLAEKSLAYRIALTKPLPLVRADREKFDQILLNLLSNAVKFTPANGRIWVDAKVSDREPGKVYLRVSDTGIGIPHEKLESIFEPFTQVDGSHSRVGQGTGLGLAISRDLARGMGGDLRARSTVGAGSAFTLTLNAAPGNAVAQAERSTVVTRESSAA